MNLLLALHGNPGLPSDFNSLAAGLQLPAGSQPVASPRPTGGAGVADLIEHMTGEICRLNPRRLVLLGYSWGAYLACRYMEAGPVRPDAVVLVNPMLAVSGPTAAAAAALMNIPVLRGIMGALLARLLPAGFVKRIFAPEAPEPAVRDSLLAEFGSGKLWLGALRYRLEQERHPLSPLSPDRCPRVAVLRGEADAVADWGQQADRLKSLGPALSVHTIAGAGHSLLWTHRDEVCAIIRRIVEEAGR